MNLQKTMIEEVLKQQAQGVPPGKILKKIECYAYNVGEMSSELRKQLTNPTTHQFKKIELAVASATLQAAYDQLRETIFECTGEEFTIELPQGTSGLVLSLLLQTLGIKLDNPIVVDSPTSN